jgi:enoyl-CoA hydratase
VIQVERSGDVTLIRLHRPEKRNALTLGMIETIRDLLREAAGDDSIRGVILAGTPPSTCAGVDLHEFVGGTPDTIRHLITTLADACAAARSCPKPIVVAIQGHCYGGALELACACDLRVAARGAQLGMPEVFVGIPSVIDAALLAHHVGFGRAQEMVLTGEPVGAEQALAWGLVNRLVEPESLLESSRALLGLAIRHDPAAIASQKRLFGDWLNLPLDEAIERSKEALAASFATGVPQRLAAERLR